MARDTLLRVSLLVMLGLGPLGCPPPDDDTDAGTDAAATDTTPPTIASIFPQADAVDVALDTVVSITFSEAIHCASVTTGMFQVLGVTAALSCDSDTVTLTPAAPLEVVTAHSVFFFGAGAVADLAGNLLAEDRSWTFTTGLGDDITPPPSPGYDAPAPPTTTTGARFLVGGAREAHASVEVRWMVGSTIRQDWVEIHPGTADDTWVGWLDLDVGTNLFALRARDRADRTSDEVSFTVTRTDDSSAPVAGGELKIQLELRDLWDDIGDEFFVWPDGTSAMNHYGVDIWVEGPFASGTTCHYDEATQQRTDTRYTGTISHCRDSRESPPYLGFWQYLNYRVPNYLAALIEAEQWSHAGTPLAATVDRRSTTGEQWDIDVLCTTPLVFTNELNQCLPRMMQRPVVDGVTEASIKGATAAPAVPGQWKSERSYRWNLTDRHGAFVEPGLYLLSVVVTVDRAQTGPAVEAIQRPADRETCWDRSDHDTRGAHRAEALLSIDGSTAQVWYLDEKGHQEVVDACDPTVQPAGVVDVCSCSGSDASRWPCTTTNPHPNTRLGERVVYMTPDKYQSSHAVRVEYCPSGACP
ncbi:MAG: Ig-like domain-containing protein [Pseudomonadota bacterium]